MPYRCDDADYLIVGQGSLIPSADGRRRLPARNARLKVGVVDMYSCSAPSRATLSKLLKGRKGVVVLERLDQPLAADLPLIREIRATVAKSLENGKQRQGAAYPELATYKKLADLPPLYSGSFGMGSRDLQPEGLIAAVENMLPEGPEAKFFYLSIDFLRDKALTPKQAIHQQALEAGLPAVKRTGRARAARTRT
jgi:pyruvate-ferredoxin/flavodoxin oxidoreductase